MADDDVLVRFDEAAIKQLLESPEGPTGRYLHACGLAVQTEAKRLASTPGPALQVSVGPDRFIALAAGADLLAAGQMSEGHGWSSWWLSSTQVGQTRAGCRPIRTASTSARSAVNPRCRQRYS